MEFFDFPPPQKTNQVPDISLSSVIQFIPSGEQIVKLIQSTAEHLRKLTNSDGYIYYQMDEALKELFICPTESTSKSCISSRYRWKLERCDTIAVYAFKNMTPILVDAKTSVDLNFPYLQAFPGLYPTYILSIPLVNFQKRCFGVVEYYRNDGRQYSEIDVKVCQFLLQHCAEAIKQNENAIFFKRFNKIQLDVQELLEKHAFVDDHEGSYTFLSNIVGMARDYTQAVSSSMFFEKHGIIRRIVNTAGVPCFPLEEESLSEKGQILRSIASTSFSINIMNRHIQGMIKVCNKIGIAQFTRLDEQILNAFAKMCKIWCLIEYSDGYLKKQKTLNEKILSLIHIQLHNAGDFNKKLRALTPTKKRYLNSWNYFVDSSVDSKILLSDVVMIIREMVLKEGLPVLEEPLWDFVVMIEQCHNSNEEIDFRNTVLCVQGLNRLLNGCKGIAYGKEAFAMIIASLCHNIAVSRAPTAVSAIFDRYNNYARDLIRFEIVQFIIQESKLLSLWKKDNQDQIFDMIKEYMVGMNLQCLKLNAEKFGSLVESGNIKALEARHDPELRALILKMMPGVGNVLGYFRSEQFRKWFPNFTLFDYLEEHNLTCVEIIMAICPR